MESQPVHNPNRSWQVTLHGFVDARRASDLLTALDVDDAERLALRTACHGQWSLVGDDRQVLQIDADEPVHDRYVTHCTQHGTRQWICGFAARVLVTRSVTVTAESPETAKQRALESAGAGTWHVGPVNHRDATRLEIADNSLVTDLTAAKIIATA